MDPQRPASVAALEDLPRSLEHEFLDPALPIPDVVNGLDAAARAGAAAAVVRPCDMEHCARILAGTAVVPASVVSFPHGTANTATKLYEARELVRRGARQLGLVVAISRLMAREFQHVQTELLQFSELCHKEGARAGAILEAGALSDELRVIAWRCAASAGMDFVETATGFSRVEYVAVDPQTVRKHLSGQVDIKISGIASLEQAIDALHAGYARIGAAEAGTILAAWQAQLAAQKQDPSGGAGPGSVS
jgi:deoxyribose-phosphate aldolase